jgi:mRNA interferase MazF
MSYKKDHDGWDKYSRKLEDSNSAPFFKEREVWWAAVGINIGHEEDGKGKEYSRPVLVLKKFDKHTFTGIPLSTTKRVSDYHYRFFFEGKENVALLGQIKTFDSRRLINRYGILDETIFQCIRKAAKDLL